jgi:DNA processing protein
MDGITRTLADAERKAWLRLFRASGIGTATFWALLERFGNARTAIERLPSLLHKSARARPVSLPSIDDIERELDQISNYGAHLIAHNEPHYPFALAATDAPPPLITAKGKLELLDRDSIAIVGSRNASAIGQRFAKEIANDLAQAGFVITSGLARGIDTAAHKGALASGTIAVMAGGLNVIYPPENAPLHSDIANVGVVVSELPFNQQPTAQHFPRRNRIISGISRGILVVEATLNSGSLITARLAGEQGRDVFAVPGSPLDPRAKGTNSLLRQGAILTETADDIVSTIRPMSRPTPKPAPTASSPFPLESSDELQAEILGRLGRMPVELDELVRLLGVPPAAVAAALLDLEFAGQLTRHPGHRVSLGVSC